MVSTDLTLEILLGVPSIATAVALIWITQMEKWMDEKSEDLIAGRPVREKYVAGQVPDISLQVSEIARISGFIANEPDIIHQVNEKMDALATNLEEIETISDSQEDMIDAMRRIRDIGILIIGITGAFGLLYGLYYDLLQTVSSAIVGVLAEFIIILIIAGVNSQVRAYRDALRTLKKKGLWRTAQTSTRA